MGNRIFRRCPILLATLVGISLLSCRTSRTISSPNSNKSDLRDRIQFMVICLNRGDSACLQRIYAADFRSLVPHHTSSSTKELIEATIHNFRTNRLTVQIEILEMEAGSEQGYALLKWRMLQQSADEASGAPQQELFLEQKRMDIWKKNEELGWQLHRTLFYR